MHQFHYFKVLKDIMYSDTTNQNTQVYWFDIECSSKFIKILKANMYIHKLFEL